MKHIHFFIFITVLIACSGQNNDTTDKKLKPAQADNGKVKEKANKSTENPSQVYSEDRQEFMDTYDKIIKIDTTLFVNADTLKIHFKYYCLKDSAVTISKEYIWEDDHLDEFITHNFVSDIRIIKNGEEIYQETIDKETFKEIAPQELLDEAVLQYPSFRGFDEGENKLTFHYSISIPATDVGTSATLHIDLNGNKRITQY
jgi:hypothetical protein